MSSADANGRHDPAPDIDPDSGIDPDLAVGLELDAEDDDAEERGGNQLEIAFTPRQILGGFALLAGLIVLLRRRRRSGSDKG